MFTSPVKRANVFHLINQTDLPYVCLRPSDHFTACNCRRLWNDAFDAKEDIPYHQPRHREYKVLSTLCMGWHIHGFLNKDQPLNHEMYFCGTFFGFTCISIFTNIGTIKGATVPLFLEAVIASFACFFFLLCSIMSMHYAEKDFHLMYLSDYEESVHPFFYINKCQSISSLTCGTAYLLHAIFAIDALIITTPTSLEPGSVSVSGHRLEENEATQPIKLYLFCNPLFRYCHCDCCDNIKCCRGMHDFFSHVDSDIKV